jgi:hypothetical protein
MSNLPKLSSRAQRALDLLADGGEIVHRLERDPYTRRDQFHTRFVRGGQVVRGLGFQTRRELESAGFRFRPVHSTSVSTYFKLEHAA